MVRDKRGASDYQAIFAKTGISGDAMKIIAEGLTEQSELPIEVALFQSNPDLLSKEDLTAIALVVVGSWLGLTCSSPVGVG